ncbi:MAG: T9SS type A sorting domain-containing protein, partial [Bacteroidales bacterium]|nr:T9SS type A sorting domain-containing protein [Bacteroidales bacterium]
ADKAELRNTTGISGMEEGQAALYQNIPNPFSQSTQIKYFLPTSVQKAFLCIYDLNGKQLKQYQLAERGEGRQQILGNEFAAGIYLYALIADGQEVEVKKMILTE